MNDTPKPRSNAISPVVTMGSGGPDNTSEAMDMTAPDRWLLDYHHTQSYAEMVPDADGDYILYSDYETLSAKLEAAEAERDAALGVLRVLGFDNAMSVQQAARQKGGE